MKEKRIAAIKKQILQIKQDLQSAGEMRPGALTRQYTPSKTKKWAFYQLSYTHNMKSRTDYVRKEFVGDLKRQIKNYKRFKALTKKWVDLAIEHSKLLIDIAVKKG